MRCCYNKTKKDRHITLHKAEIYHDIDALTYKLGETVVENKPVRDSVSSDSEDTLDGAVLYRLMNLRAAILRRRLSFCLKKDHVLEIDNRPTYDETYEFYLSVPESFDDNNMEVLMTYMHEYIVRGSLLDWYRKLGTTFGESLEKEVLEIESKIVDGFRGEIIRHPMLPYIPSHRTR